VKPGLSAISAVDHIADQALMIRDPSLKLQLLAIILTQALSLLLKTASIARIGNLKMDINS